MVKKLNVTLAIKVICDIILGFILAANFIVLTYPMGTTPIQRWHDWVGTAFGLGLAYCAVFWNREDIEKLKKEIKELKNNKQYDVQ